MDSDGGRRRHDFADGPPFASQMSWVDEWAADDEYDGATAHDDDDADDDGGGDARWWRVELPR